MKHIKILILVFILTPFVQSQTNNAQYFPLNAGNKFFYKKLICGPGSICDTSYFVSRILHTKVFNGKTYYYCQGFLGWGPVNSLNMYLRYDSLSGCLVMLDSLNTVCNYEKKVYKFSSQVGDSTGISCVFGDNYQCTRIFDTTLFNISLNSKKYRFGFANNTVQRIKETMFARYVGAYYVSSITNTSHSTQRRYNYLKGALINGVVYGDTSMIVIVGIEPISTEIPDKFELMQNYPNPFNPSTKIKFQINKSGIVKLSVFDSRGNVVRDILNERKNAGEYSAEFNGNGLSSGVYFYKLEVNGISETKRMLMIK